MRIPLPSQMSRLKKKLMLYFILIAIVSISVSAEIILEVSSDRFMNSVRSEIIYGTLDEAEAKQIREKYGHDKGRFYEELKKRVIEQKREITIKNIDPDEIFSPIYNLRNRMILLLLVISASIIFAFIMFTKDIVSPMDGIVEATKKIAEGDLTVSVPVMTEDEIGQIAGLINDMNANLQDMIVQMRQEINRHKGKIFEAYDKIAEVVNLNNDSGIIENKKMRLSDFRKMKGLGKEVVSSLETMIADLSELLTFLEMYKTYKIQSEVSQNEIENALKGYQTDIWINEEE
ncbi:MAG: HAMP domain-containing protein [bacterium]|nr:HAMP domain-containing protein [bacterium]